MGEMSCLLGTVTTTICKASMPLSRKSLKALWRTCYLAGYRHEKVVNRSLLIVVSTAR